MTESHVGKRVSFTDPQGRERTGVVVDHKVNRIAWQGRQSIFVRTDDELERRFYWSDEYELLTKEDNGD